MNKHLPDKTLHIECTLCTKRINTPVVRDRDYGDYYIFCNDCFRRESRYARAYVANFDFNLSGERLSR